MIYGFFPVKASDKTIYPLQWQKSDEEDYLYVWGFELLCIQAILDKIDKTS